MRAERKPVRRKGLWALGCAALVWLSAGCQSARFARSADRHLEQGAAGQALADYRAALSHDRLSEEDRRDVEARAAEAARQYAEQRIRDAERLPEDLRFGELASIITAGAWGSERGLASARRAIEPLLERRWIEVEAAVAEVRFSRALALASALLPLLPADHPLQRRRDVIRRLAAEHHVRTASTAPPAASFFHLHLARRFGAAVEPPPRPGDPARPAVAWRWEGQSCPSFQELLRQRRPSPPEGQGAVEVVLNLERCAMTEEQGSSRRQYQFIDRSPELVVQEEEYWVAPPVSCEGACRRFDPLGVCVERAESAPCEPAPPALVKRNIPRIVHRDITRTATHTVHTRTVRAILKGRLVSGGLEVPIAVERVVTDEAFWTPDLQRSFGQHLSLAAVESELANGLASMIDQARHLLEQKRVEVVLAEAQRAELAGQPLAADDAYVRAVWVRNHVPPAAARWFAEHHGLDSTEATLLALGQPSPEPVASLPAPAPVPPPSHEVWRALDDLAPILSKQEARGADILTTVGFQIGWFLRQPPFESAGRGSGLALAFHGDDALLRLEGQPRQLGSETGGFSLALAGLAAGWDTPGPRLAIGVIYAYEASDLERQQLFGPTFAIHLPLVSWISADLELRPNILWLKELADEDPEDPHFYSPVSLGVTFDLWQRFYLVTSATHPIGSRGRIDLGAELGFRL